ncbi:MAG: hypothetical protein PHW93_03995 [Candidatus Methanomethylophilaceae archaeon]|nr:hypothetical protein [Candidatus Methanomethylophilaceae archaeon]
MSKEVLLLSNESEIFIIDGLEGGRRWSDIPSKFRSMNDVAERIFGGRFTEIGRFRERLSLSFDAHLAIVTFGYGLVNGKDIISPYEGYCEGEHIPDVEERNGLTDAVRSLTKTPNRIIVCLPNDLLAYLLDAEALPLQKCVFVASPSMHSRLSDGSLVLTRRGSRLGHANAEQIMDYLKKETMEKSGADAGI